ncbi:hypothetical protein PoB_000160400 [Plakobranchus ocellatus]|uniref:Peptidase S1 domain-containing protein n=1 Tax=Plakobranchus ocellatus TaxID=259542 RepID=A0AAV3XZE2_9GAST|nr:hypothetical protein PoB_000160400 [Plakobranchus ocellatus]
MFSDNFVTENHEAELADDEAEGGRPLSKKPCKNHPGHPQFIPIKCFRETHLPPELRDDAGKTYNQILCQAKLTVKIRGGFISKDRPEGFPFFKDRGLFKSINGTGFITNVQYVFKEPVFNRWYWIKSSVMPDEKVWTISIVTAAHVVFDQAEVEACQVILDFDDEEAEREGRVVTLRGATLIEKSSEGDWCQFECFTEDRDLATKLTQTMPHYYLSGREHILRTIEVSDNPSNMIPMDSLKRFYLHETLYDIIHKRRPISKDKRALHGTGDRRDILSKLDHILIWWRNKMSSSTSRNKEDIAGHLWAKLDSFTTDELQTFQGLLYKDDQFSDSDCSVLVSHPHGCSKMVSIGTYGTLLFNYSSECLTYDTPTCPGSSGALVMCRCKGFFCTYIHYGKNGKKGFEPGINQSSQRFLSDRGLC